MRFALVLVLVATPLVAGCKSDPMPFSLRPKPPAPEQTHSMALEQAPCPCALDGARSSR